MKIQFEVDRDQAETLLTVLKRIRTSEIAQQVGVDWAIFDRACTELRMALQDVVEPDAS